MTKKITIKQARLTISNLAIDLSKKDKTKPLINIKGKVSLTK